MAIQFWYVRHGETVFNRKGRVQGVCDSPLTDTGIEQAKQAAEALEDQPFDRVFVSSSGRAKETASYLLKGREQEMEILDSLHEMNFGKVEGSRFTSHIDQLRACFDTGDFTSLDGESVNQLQARIDHAFNTMERTCRDGDRVLIVGHGMYERYVMNHLLGVDFKKLDEERNKERRNGVPNASIMTFVFEDGKYQLVTLPIEADRYHPAEMPKTVHFYYMRHGECLFDVWSRMQGVSDSPLTEKGLHEALVSADALAKIPFAAVYTSPLGRAWKTGEIIMSKHPDLRMKFYDGLKEVNFGDFEGVQTNDWMDEIHERHVRKGWKDVNGESIDDVALRIHSTLQHLVAQAKDGDNILLIGHSTYYCNLVQNLFHITRDDLFNDARKQGKQATPNGGVARFDWHHDHFELIQPMMAPEDFWNQKEDSKKEWPGKHLLQRSFFSYCLSSVSFLSSRVTYGCNSPTYLYAGRMIRLANSTSSIRCAHQPATLDMAKIGVKRSSSIPKTR
jgi:broad specificity phosphatase PhoE